MKNISPAFTALISLLLLTACGAPVGLGLTSAAGIYATKPGDLPPADTADQIAPHESWCYKTLGAIDCYSQPQDANPNSLMNVDPPNRYPLTRQAYADALAQSQEAAKPKEMPKDDASLNMTPIPVPSTEVTPAPTVTPPANPAPKTVKHKKHKKIKKKPVKPMPQAVPNPPGIPN